MTESCDYCGTDLQMRASRWQAQLRPVGFTEVNGHRAPLVKVHCGKCPVDDELDQAALDAVANWNFYGASS